MTDKAITIGRFYVKAEKNIIIEKGVRAFIMEKILNTQEIERGLAVNIDDKTVEVQLKGEKGDVIKFSEGLKKEIIRKFGNSTITFTDYEEDLTLEIPEHQRASHALTIGQLSKGIEYQKDIKNLLENLPKRIGKEIAKLINKNN